MKEKKECKIVQDLLPNYIEKLTNEETNNFIEEHLKDCNECKLVFENMQKEIKIDNEKLDGRKVKYIKKYNKKLKTLKIILFIILLVFLIKTVRNFIIITDLSNKTDQYACSSNFSRKSIAYAGEEITITEFYYKDGKWKNSIQYIILNEDSKKLTSYNDGSGKANIYYDINGEKTVRLNTEDMMKLQLFSYFGGYDNILQKILGSATASIKSVNCNGKECYLVNYYASGEWLYKGNINNTGIYLDKETGFIIRNTELSYTNGDTGNVTDRVVDFRYEFGNVTDEDFIEPDISEYEILQ